MKAPNKGPSCSPLIYPTGTAPGPGRAGFPTRASDPFLEGLRVDLLVLSRDEGIRLLKGMYLSISLSISRSIYRSIYIYT